MAWYRTDDGQGTVHVNFGRKGGPAPCQAPRLSTDSEGFQGKCFRMGGKLCDAPVGETYGGQTLTCDMPLCAKHATHVEGQDLDYCPRHRQLAAAPL